MAPVYRLRYAYGPQDSLGTTHRRSRQHYHGFYDRITWAFLGLLSTGCISTVLQPALRESLPAYTNGNDTSPPIGRQVGVRELRADDIIAHEIGPGRPRRDRRGDRRARAGPDP